jgi:hypothetical protein
VDKCKPLANGAGKAHQADAPRALSEPAAERTGGAWSAHRADNVGPIRELADEHAGGVGEGRGVGTEPMYYPPVGSLGGPNP